MAADAGLQQRAQFVLVGFVQPDIALLGLQFVKTLLQHLLLQLNRGIQDFLSPAVLVAGQLLERQLLQCTDLFSFGEVFQYCPGSNFWPCPS